MISSSRASHALLAARLSTLSRRQFSLISRCARHQNKMIQNRPQQFRYRCKHSDRDKQVVQYRALARLLGRVVGMLWRSGARVTCVCNLIYISYHIIIVAVDKWTTRNREQECTNITVNICVSCCDVYQDSSLGFGGTATHPEADWLYSSCLFQVNPILK